MSSEQAVEQPPAARWESTATRRKMGRALRPAP